jgi:hypothetical protein
MWLLLLLLPSQCLCLLSSLQDGAVSRLCHAVPPFPQQASKLAGGVAHACAALRCTSLRLAAWCSAAVLLNKVLCGACFACCSL